jgi:site-specific recombinase XerD
MVCPAWRIIKQVFDNAIGHLQSTREAHEREAERLRQASAHWLRHTTGSRMMDGQVDLRYVRDNLGHESISTTSQCTRTTTTGIAPQRLD